MQCGDNYYVVCNTLKSLFVITIFLLIFFLIFYAGCEAFLSDLDKLPCIQIGDFKLRLELDDDLSPELLDVSVKELRETPEQQEKSIAELKALLESK